MAKIVKPNVVRGQIFDKLAATFGDSTLGMYDGKLRIEILDDNGDVVQFSLAPVIHKTLVDEAECDKLVPIDDQVAAYEAANAAKTAENLAKKEKTAAKKAKSTKKAAKADKPAEDVSSTGSVAVVTPAELTAEEQSKLDDLASLLDSGAF